MQVHTVMKRSPLSRRSHHVLQINQRQLAAYLFKKNKKQNHAKSLYYQLGRYFQQTVYVNFLFFWLSEPDLTAETFAFIPHVH